MHLPFFNIPLASDCCRQFSMELSLYLFVNKNFRKSGSKHGVLRPVYILQPEEAPLTNGKHGRQYRRYDRGRSFSPPKHFRGQHPLQGDVEAIPLGPVYNCCNGNCTESNGRDKHSDNSDEGLQYPELAADRPKTGRPHGFQKSFSSDQLYFNDRLPLKLEPYSFSLSSRSSSTSTGSSIRSGFWHKSAIPVPIIEPKFKLRNNNSSIASTSGPLIPKRSAVASAHQSPTSSKSSARHQPAQDNGSITRLSLPTPQSSGSESSGYFTPSPPESHPPAFIKMDTEERLSSDIEEPLSSSVNNNSRDCIDSHSPKSVSDGSSKVEDHKEIDDNSRSGSGSQHHYLGEEIHDKYPSVESIHLNNYQDSSEQRPLSRLSLVDSNPTIEIRSKSKSVIDLPNFLPRIESQRSIINSAPAKNEKNGLNNNETTPEPYQTDNSSASKMPLPPAEHSSQIVASTSVTITKSKLERRFSRNNSRKSMKASPRNHQGAYTNRLVSKPKDLLQHVLNEMDNPNWETTVSGLQGLARVTRQNPEVIEHQMHQVCISVAKHIKNLRSQVARVACNTAADLFLHCKHGLDMELDEIACPLLQRTADTNRFLRADANAALDIMCEQLPIHRVIPVITFRGCGHQNAVVRATAVRILGDIVRRLGSEGTLALPKELRDRLLLSAANSLADGNLDTRSQAKSLFKCLIGQPQFHKYLHEAVPQNILRHISKVLLSIKPDS